MVSASSPSLHKLRDLTNVRLGEDGEDYTTLEDYKPELFKAGKSRYVNKNVHYAAVETPFTRLF